MASEDAREFHRVIVHGTGSSGAEIEIWVPGNVTGVARRIEGWLNAARIAGDQAQPVRTHEPADSAMRADGFRHLVDWSRVIAVTIVPRLGG